MEWSLGSGRDIQHCLVAFLEREWSVWRGAAAAVNLIIRYVSVQLPLYCDYLFVREPMFKPVVEPVVCWNEEESVDILLCSCFPSKKAAIWSSKLQAVVAYISPRHMMDCPDGWHFHQEKISHFVVGGCTDDVTVF